ncbi:MAG: leucine-rich repeat domain-containing protein, partial [Candidatus Coproplasma sp.]
LSSVNFGTTITVVHDYAFSDSGIRSFDASAVTSIGEAAFLNCRNLTEIDFGSESKIDEIPQYAFSGCYALKEIDVPASVVKICEKAFSGCKAMEQVTLSAEGKLEYIGDSAFYGCSSVWNIKIPQTVTQMGASVFSGCSSLKNVALPSDILVVPNGTFEDCVSLESYEAPEGTTEIGDYAFSGCIGLVSVKFPESLKIINQYAFSSCRALSEIVLPDSIESVGRGAFSYCTSLAGFTAPFVGETTDTNTYLSYVFGNGKFSAFLVPDSLKTVTVTTGDKIDQAAFYGCSSITVINLPDSLNTIGSQAFSGCTSLDSLIIPDGVTEVGSGALKGCTGLTSLTLPFVGQNVQSNRFLAYVFGGSSYYNYSSVPESLKTVTITKADEISPYAFYYNSYITEVNLPETLMSIGSSAFNGCSSLESLVVPDSVTSIGQSAFRSCNSLKSLTLPFVGQSYRYNAYLAYNFGASSAESYSYIPDSLVSVTVTTADTVGNKAFYYCRNLTEINIPDSVTSIGAYAFYYASKIESINLTENLQTIGNYAFARCSSFESLVIPDSVTSLGLGVFSECYSIKSLTLPFVGQSYSSNTYLAYNFGSSYQASYNYFPQALTSVTVTQTETIGSYAFYGGQYLREINLPDNIVSIGGYAFSGCRRLTRIELPATLSTIYDSAFSDCYSLYDVMNRSSLPITAGSSAYGCVGQFALKVYSSEEERMQEVVSDDFVFAEADGVWYMVSYDYGKESLSLPSSFAASGKTVKSYRINSYLFYNDNNIKTVTIPDSVSQLGYKLFSNCGWLESVTFGSGSAILSIPEQCFSYCDKLSSVNIPKSVTVIYSDAFSWCKSLTEITLGKNVGSVYGGAFTGCYNLREVYNLSSLTVEKGSMENGEVGRWAMKIYTTETPADKLQYATIAGISYAIASDDCRVIACDDSLTEIEFNEFTYNERVISSYTIAPYALEGKDNLVSVKFGSAVKEIGEYSFAYCSNLENVTFMGTGVSSIGKSAFYYCKSLKTLALPEGVTSVGSYAFGYNYSLYSVSLPKSLNNIGDEAFYQCRLLVEVLNASSLTVTKGSTANGRVAQYALSVTNSSVSQTVEEDGFIFIRIGGKWSLVGSEYNKYYSDNLCVLPGSFEYGGTTVSSYAIGANVFTYVSTSSVIIPANVTAIDNSAFYVSTVYYGGTEEEWTSLTSGLTLFKYVTVYHYANCVHSYGQWTYDSAGNVVTTVVTHDREAIAPTCEEPGMYETVCSVCGEVIETYEVSETGHFPDRSGVCMVCEKEGTLVTSENIDSLGLITNDSAYPFSIGEDGTLTSTNALSGTASTLTLKADREMTVYVYYDKTTDAYNDFTISYNYSEGYYYSAGYLSYNLVDGDVLKFLFRLGETVEEGTQNCVNINLIIYFSSEEAA